VLRLEARPRLEVPPEDLHHHVVEAHVEVLRDLHVVRRDVELEVGELREFPAVVAGHADDLAADLLGVLDRLDHVVGVAAPGDREDQIALAELVLELVVEDVLEGHVVGDRHEGRDVVVEADEPEPLLDVRAGAFVEVADHVGRGGGAAAVPEDVDRRILLVMLKEAVHRLVELIDVEVLDDLDLAGVVILDIFLEINHKFSPLLVHENNRAAGLVELKWHFLKIV